MKHHKKHMVWMLMGCLVPILLLAVLPRIGVNLGPLARYVPYAAVLICPLIHIGMMVFMLGGKKDNCSDHQKNESQQEAL